MLRSLRKFSQSPATKVLYAVLAGLFVWWGVGGGIGQQVDWVAKVHGDTITTRDLYQAEAELRRRYEELFKNARSADLLRNLDLRGRALDELIDEALVRHEASQLGVEVSDTELVAAITAMPEFQQNGQFDRGLVERTLRFQRDRGEFEDRLRRSLVLQRVQALVTDGVQVSDAEVEERYRLDKEQVNLTFVRVDAQTEGQSLTPTDAELEKQLADHADRYRLPTRTRARYVAYRPADFAAQVQLTDTEIAAYYDEHKEDRFTEAEQVRARHILVKLDPGANDEAKAAARKKAEGLLAKVKGGGDFAAVAKASSDDPGSAAKGGDLGLFGRGTMTPAFEAVAFALQPGQVSDLVETPFGFHVIKVEEHKAGGLQPLDAVRAEIVKALQNERGLELARAQAEADRRKVVEGAALAQAVGGRHIEESPLFPQGAPLVPGVGPVKAFVDAAFALREGEVSDLIETDDSIYLLTPFERSESHVPPLAEVRDRVIADVRRQRGEEAAKAKAETLRTRAGEIGLAKAAAEANLKVDETGPFERRGGAIPKLGALTDLRTDAFTLTSPGALAPKVYSAGGDAVVAALEKRIPADMSGFATAKDGVADGLLQQRRQAAIASYMTILKKRALDAGALEVRADVAARG
jgi:peptidyl-prolyl cis-trans isomerase D